MNRIGFGTDVHRLAEGRKLFIGGVEIDSPFGAEGHSDADVLLHAITDALLGAAALGDIGSHFPSDDERWLNAESGNFVLYVRGLLHARNFSIENVDCTVDLESPKLRPYIDRVRESIAALLEIDVDQVSVKAKTGEKLDAVGLGRAIRAQAIVLLARPA